MMRAICCLVGMSIGCGSTASPATFPDPDELGSRHVTCTVGCGAPPPAAFDRAKVRFHMRGHFKDLRTVERLLIDGRLAEATSLAFLLSRPVVDAGLEAWTAEMGRVSQAALALSGATSLDAACRLEPRVAAACADCHRRAGALPAFDRVPPLPPDDPEPRARMARHQWAADRLWEGIVGPSDRSWRAGLEVLAATPLPSTPGEAGPRLQRLARGALDAVLRNTVADHAETYGELLVACTSCHASRVPRPGPVAGAP